MRGWKLRSSQKTFQGDQGNVNRYPIVHRLQIEAKKATSPLETRFFPSSIALPAGKRRFRW